MKSNILFEKLYEEVYGPKLTPKNLLDNLELDNYHSVNLFKENGFVIAVTKCDLPNGKKAEFKYIFKDNKLMSMFRKFKNKPDVTLYDRETEIAKLRKELKSSNLNTDQIVS